MSRTVAIISDTGRLVNVLGADKENDARYLKFVKRILGSAGSKATLNYGWNGDAELVVTGADGTGERITLDAQEVVVPGNIVVAGRTLDQITSEEVDLEMSGLRGTEGEITVETYENPDFGSSGSSDEDQPRYIRVVGLSPSIMSRLRNVEERLDALFRFDDVYYAGDGLEAVREGPDVNNTINVRLGYGLKFVPVDDSSDSGSDADEPVYTTRPPTAIAVDLDALHIGGIVMVDPETGNMALYRNDQEE